MQNNANVNPVKVLKHFGLVDKSGNPLNPFSQAVRASEIFRSARFTDMLNSVEMYAMDGVMCAVVGPVGSGKTTFVNALCGRLARRTGDVTAVVARVDLPDQDELRVSKHVYPAMADALREFGVGALPNNMYARKQWMRRSLGDTLAGAGKRIIIVVDEAHNAHPKFYKGIKTITELEWCGERIPVGIVFVGQPALYTKLLSAPDVMLRLEQYGSVYEFNKMTDKEVLSYLNFRTGKCGRKGIFDRRAAAIISRRANALAINSAAWGAMVTAYGEGADRVLARHALTNDNLSSLIRECGLSYSAVAEETPWSVTTVRDVCEGGYKGADKDGKKADIFKGIQDAILKAGKEERMAV